jgi:hypothetical protein
MNRGEALSMNEGLRRSAVGPHQVPGAAGEHRQGLTLEGGVKTGIALLHRWAPSLSQPRPSQGLATQVRRYSPSVVARAEDVNIAVRAPCPKPYACAAYEYAPSGSYENALPTCLHGRKEMVAPRLSEKFDSTPESSTLETENEFGFDCDHTACSPICCSVHDCFLGFIRKHSP